MIKFLLVALCGPGLMLCWPAASNCGPQVDSKAWGSVNTTGPPIPGAVEAQRAKLAVLEEIASGLRPFPGVIGSTLPGIVVVPPVPDASSSGTSRPLSGAELAAAEARIRAKLAAVAHPAAASRWLGPLGPLPPKPHEMGTSFALAGEALARSLALQREKLSSPVLAPPGMPVTTVARPDRVGAQNQSVQTAIPGTSLNEEQQGKLEAARAASRAAARAPQDRP
jgi:hypothetical protein